MKELKKLRAERKLFHDLYIKYYQEAEFAKSLLESKQIDKYNTEMDRLNGILRNGGRK